jgi:hypothetical protein
MDLVSLRRQHISWTIQQNPTTITIHRTEKIDMGGYFEEVESEVGSFVVRIYQYGTWIPQDVSTLAGTKQVDKTWGMLADWQADIKAGPNVLDEFDVPGVGRFQTLEVYPQVVKGELVGYQVALEKVS